MGIREQRRRETMEKILADADRQLIDGGPAALSVREIARSLGLASSAMYRYVSSRDELLTLMIDRSYAELADAVEDSLDREDSPEQQLRSLCHAVRGWARAHPQHYGLLYGTPVPVFHAPQTTVESGSRVLFLLADILQNLGGAPQVSADFEKVTARETDIAPEAVARTALAWSALLGAISSEVFGYLGPGFTDVSDELFELVVERIVAG